MAEAEKSCPRCREKVKLLASLCKHCGYEFSATEMAASRKLNETTGYVGLGCFSVVIILLLLAFCGKSDDATQVRADPTTTEDSSSGYGDVSKQYAWISAGKEQIRTALKDPESADFRNVHFYSGGGVPVACGEVNAKNGFGGYTGFERFVAAGSVLAVTESMVEGGIGPVWDKYCVKAGIDKA